MRHISGPFNGAFASCLRRLFFLLIPVFFFSVTVTSAQDCDFFVNATDGDDANPGTLTQPVRSFENAYQVFPTGALVCLAAGEYFLGSDGDGIVLGAQDKNMTFRLESFGGSGEVRFSEGSWTLDAGQGQLTFETGSASRLTFGVGIQNADAVSPSNLNFLHTLDLRSGTLDVSGVSVQIGPSVGNPSFANPDNTSKTAPPSAALRFGNGRIVGDVAYQTATRTFEVSSSNTTTESYPLPSDLGASRLIFSNSGPVVFGAQVSFSSSPAPIRILSGQTGSVMFSGGLRFRGPVRADTLIAHAGSGDVTIASLATESSTVSDESSVLSLSAGGSLSISSALYMTDPGASAWAWRPVVTSGTLILGATAGIMTVKAGLENAGSVRLAGDLVIEGSSSNGILNPGLIETGTSILTLSGADFTVSNSGSIEGSGARLALAGSSTWSENGMLPGITVASGTHSLSTSTVNGSFRVDDGASAVLSGSSDVSITGDLSLGSVGSLFVTGPISGISIANNLLAASGSTIDMGSADFTIGGNTTTPGLSVATTTHRFLFNNSGTHSIDAADAVLPGFSLAVGSLDIISNLVANGSVSLSGERVLLSTGVAVSSNDVTLSSGSLTIENNASWSSSGPSTFSGTVSLGPGASLSTVGNLTMSGSGNTVTLGTGARLESRANMVLNFVTVSGGPASELRTGADLTVSGSSVVLPLTSLIFDGNNNQSAFFAQPARFDRLLINGAQTILSLAGSLQLTQDLNLTEGSFTLLTGASVLLGSNLSRSGGTFSGAPGTTIQFLGTGNRVISGFDNLALPRIRIVGPSLSVVAPVSTVEDLIVGPGSVLIGQNVQLSIGDSLTVSTGLFVVGSGSTVTVKGRTTLNSSTIQIGSGAGLAASNDMTIRSGSLLAPDGVLVFQGNRPLVLDSDIDLALGSLSVSGSGTALTIAGGKTLTVGAVLTVGVGTVLNPESSIIDLTAASGAASFVCDGVVSGSASGGVLYSGTGVPTPTLQLSGGGTLGNTTINLASPESIILVSPASTLKLGGSLVVSKGRLDLQGTLFDFVSTGTTPSIALDLSDGFISPRLFDSVGTSIVNASQTVYDLGYTGTLPNIYNVGDEASYGPIRNLSVSAVDALNSPAVFGTVLSIQTSVSGSLSIAENALFRLDGVDLTFLGPGSANIINGQLNGTGALIIKEDGAFFSNTTSSGGSLMTRVEIQAPEEATVHLTNLQEISSINLLSGDVIIEGFTGQSPMQIGAGITQVSGVLDIQRDLDVGMAVSPAAWISNGGSTRISDAIRVLLSSGSRLDIATGSTWNVSTSPTATVIPDGGFVVFSGGGLLSALSSIPRLKLTADDTGNDDLFFTGNVTISDRLVIEDGDLFIGTATLTHLGSLWQHDVNGSPGDGSGDDIIGDFSGPGGLTRLLGSVRVELGGDLNIQSSAFDVASVVGDTVTVRTTNQPHRIVVANRSFSLASGTLDIGRNDLILQGNSDPLATLDGGSIIGGVSDRTISVQGSVLSVGRDFPFNDDDFGEVVLRSPTAASILVRTPTDVSNLTVDRSISLADGNAPLIIGGRLVFGEQGAGVIMSGSVPLSIGSGASILRRGSGILSSAPVFVDTVSVYYDIDDGDVSGHDSQFTGGTLITGVELPSSSSNARLRIVGVLSGGVGGTPNTVRLSNGLRIDEALIVYGGGFNKGSASLHFATGSSLRLSGVDPDHGPVFASSAAYTTAAPFGLSIGSGISSVTINEALLPQSVTNADLVLRMGDATSETPRNVLVTGNRTLASLTIDNLNTTSSINTDGSALTITGDVTVVKGIVTSGPASLLSVGSNLTVGTSGKVSGSIIADVSGDVSIQGVYSGLTLQAEGNVNLPGTLSGSTSLLFTGQKQLLTIPTGGLNVSTLTLSAPGEAVSPELSFIGTDGSTADLRVTSSLNLRNGILRTGSGTVILEGSGSGFDRQVQTGNKSHVLGRIRRSIPSGFTGDVVWPVGDSLSYRPLSLSFPTAVITQTDLTVRYADQAPFGEAGFPITTSGSPIIDTLPYSWTVQSSVNFARSLSWGFTIAGIVDSTVPPDVLLPVLRTPANVFDDWRVPAGSTDNSKEGGLTSIRKAAFTGGLDPIGTLIAVGTPKRQGPSIGFQVANLLPAEVAPGGIDIYIGETLLGSTVGEGQAAPRLQDGLSGPIAESRTAVLVLGGDDPETQALDTATFLLAPGNRSTIVAALDDTGSPTLFVNSDGPDRGTDPSKTGLSVLNLTTDAQAIDADVPWPSHVDLATSLPFGSFSPTAFFDPALTVIGVNRSSDGSLIDHFSFDLSAAADEMVTMIVAGTTDGDTGGGPLLIRTLREDGSLQTGTIVTDTQEEPELPLSFHLTGNYPNPFNPVTTIAFDLAEAASVHVEVFDMLGRRVLVTPVASFPRGAGSIQRLDASRLASGVYLYRVLARTSTHLLSKTSRMIVLK